MHSFIPDASFVGTAFVNCITNILVFNILKFLYSFLNINYDCSPLWVQTWFSLWNNKEKQR